MPRSCAMRGKNLATDKNVTVMSGPLVDGAAAQGPYDVYSVAGDGGGAGRIVSPAQGRWRLVTVMGRSPNGRATLYRRDGADISGRPIFDAAAPTLPGFAAIPSFVF